MLPSFKLRKIYSLIVGLIAIILCATLTYNFFPVFPGREHLELNDKGAESGLTATELKDEIGRFAEPKYEKVLATYEKDLTLYRTLKFNTLSPQTPVDGIVATIAPPLQTVFKHDSESKQLFAVYGDTVWVSLAKHLSLLLLRLSGSSCDQYLSSLGSDYEIRFEIPSPDGPPDRLRSFCSQAHLSMPSPMADQKTLSEFFCSAYATADQFRDHSNRIVGWSSADDTWIGGLAEFPTAQDMYFANIIDLQARGEKQNLFFRGALAAGCLTMTAPKEPPVGVTGRNGILHSQIILIVKTQGNDAYPVGFVSYYDAKSGNWFLSGVTRYASPRMATTLQIVF